MIDKSNKRVLSLKRGVEEIEKKRRVRSFVVIKNLKTIGIGERISVPYWTPQPSKEEGVWIIDIVNGSKRHFSQGRYIIPLFNLPEEDQKLSPEKAFQKHLSHIMVDLERLSKTLPQTIKGVTKRLTPLFLM
jgi:hypothetical protein